MRKFDLLLSGARSLSRLSGLSLLPLLLWIGSASSSTTNCFDEEECKSNCLCIAENEIDDDNVTGDGNVLAVFPTVPPVITPGCCPQPEQCPNKLCKWDYGQNRITWMVDLSIWTSTENMAEQVFPPPNASYTNVQNVRHGYTTFQVAQRGCGGTYHMEPVVALDVNGNEIGWAQLHLTCGSCVLPPIE